jgi:hypothetical protein
VCPALFLCCAVLSPVSQPYSRTESLVLAASYVPPFTSHTTQQTSLRARATRSPSTAPSLNWWRTWVVRTHTRRTTDGPASPSGAIFAVPRALRSLCRCCPRLPPALSSLAPAPLCLIGHRVAVRFRSGFRSSGRVGLTSSLFHLSCVAD